jgi:hypothetical protein
MPRPARIIEARAIRNSLIGPTLSAQCDMSVAADQKDPRKKKSTRELPARVTLAVSSALAQVSAPVNF